MVEKSVGIGLNICGLLASGLRGRVSNEPLALNTVITLGALAEECLVARAANEGEVLMAPGLLKDELGQFLFGGGELLAGGDAHGFKEALLDQLRAAGLDGEVSLGKGDLLLPGIAILGDKVAGVAGEHDVINLTPGARADFDHFVDVNKMVCGAVAGDLAGGFGLGNSGLVEVAPLASGPRCSRGCCPVVLGWCRSWSGQA